MLHCFVDGEPAGINLRKIGEIRDQSRHVQGGSSNGFSPLFETGPVRVHGIPRNQQRRSCEHGGQRRSQVMRDDRQNFLPRADGTLRLIVQTCIVDGEGRASSEILGHSDVVHGQLTSDRRR